VHCMQVSSRLPFSERNWAPVQLSLSLSLSVFCATGNRKQATISISMGLQSILSFLFENLTQSSAQPVLP
jgi:hypothetical protein